MSSKVDFIKAEGNLIAAVSLREISILIRLRKVKHTIKFKEDIVDILMIGKVLIVALSKHLEIYDAESGAFLKKLELSSAQKPNSKICSIVHPHTYVNKILVASTDGKILLVNFDSGEELYTYSFKEPVEFVEQVILQLSPSIMQGFIGFNHKWIIFHYKNRIKIFDAEIHTH